MGIRRSRVLVRRGRIAGAVGLAILTILFAIDASSASAAATTASTTETSTCTLPGGGTGQATEDLSATFPASGSVGRPVQPTGLTVALALSPQLTDGLRAAGATSVGAGVTGQLTAGAQSAPLGTVSAPSSALPQSGGARLVAKGTVAPVTPSQPGDLVFSAGSMTPTLSVTTVHDGVATASTITCTPGGAPSSPLATVPVPADPGPQAPGSGAPAPGGGGGGAGAGPAPVSPQDSGINVVYLLSGINTIAKLHSSVEIHGAFHAHIELTPPYSVSGTLELDQAHGTFLSFRFVPVESAIDFTQDGPTTGTYNNGILDVTNSVAINVSNAAVNGTTLPVGTGCHAAGVQIHLHGPFTTLLQGSTTFRTTVTVPPFGDCGVTENLDPLLTGLISGPDNPLQITLQYCTKDPHCPGQ